MPSWSESDQGQLAKALTVLINGQKAYGKEYNVSDVFDYFRMKMEGRYAVKPILAALSAYTDKNDDMPTPANIIAILSPEKRKITHAEYIAAQKMQDASGYPRFSPEAYLIREYEAQDRETSADNPAIADSLKARLLK